MVNVRILNSLLAAGLGLCCCGCITKTLWTEHDCIVPSPVPKLALTETDRGILVQYDAETERNGDIRRRAYLLEPNLRRIAAGKRPVYINSSSPKAQKPIPVFLKLPADRPAPEIYAVCPSNGCTFTIYRGRKMLGPCDLPVFKDGGQTAKQVALTPLAVAGDVSVVGAITAPIWLPFLVRDSSVAWSAPDGTPANSY